MGGRAHAGLTRGSEKYVCRVGLDWGVTDSSRVTRFLDCQGSEGSNQAGWGRYGEEMRREVGVGNVEAVRWFA